MAELKNVYCSYCSGTGKKTCDRCNGTGKVLGRVNWNRYYTCSKCNGAGEVKCSTCNGSGTYLVEEDE